MVHLGRAQCPIALHGNGSHALAKDLGDHYARHLHQLGKVHKLAQWAPHDLTERDRQRRAEVATQLLSHKRTDSWLKPIITGDEKWCLVVNIKRSRHWIDKGKIKNRANNYLWKVIVEKWNLLLDLGKLGQVEISPGD
ncbi:unnamed protein product [Heligmosomoides polygyrus]|uniref:Transposase n=1 Tax=Heligmosomoides polygyrus TaxID=6339 RepID=A0A183G471_HELPZ|nr:unnamed protein product [Heligmosomoides polygyrus]